ncbi:hypothetical protein TIFTF001_038831 [Ficus carica]|uniref:Uncharacterized protein n=1 Tax=Ficus carica TaxID=3494 RepID=A0AA88E8P7_FICCA|nr:hypothetical protein TIFTF001_038831 [Ficus carica]
MASAAAEMIFRCVFEGSISMQDMEIERRPYHKNCHCALHKRDRGIASDACSHQRNFSFPRKKSWADCALSMENCFSNSFYKNSLLLLKPNQECSRRDHGASSTLSQR